MPRAVFLTPEQYKTLRTDAALADIENDPKRATPKPPVKATILSASYVGTIIPGADVVALKVTYEIECFLENENEWTEIPLQLPRTFLGKVEVDSQTALRVAAPTKKGAAPPMLLTRGRGRHQVVAYFHLPVKHSARGDSISIRPPEVASASLKLTLPADADLESALPFVRDDAGTSAQFVLPSKAGRDHEIRWTARKVAPIPGGAILQTCSYIYNIDSTRVHADLGMVLSSSLRDLPNQYEIRFPKNVRILSVEGTELRGWTRDAQSGAIKADLIPGDHDATDLRILAETDIPPAAEGKTDIEVILPIASIPGTHRANGTFSLIGSDDIRVKKILTNTLTAAIPDNVEGGVSSLPNYIVSFSFPALTESPTITLSPVQDRFNARIDTLVSLKREAIYLTRTLNLIPLEGNLFTAQIALPNSEEILTIESPGENNFSWSGNDDDSGEVRLIWDSGLTAGNPATVTIKTRRDPEGWYSLGSEAAALTFQQATIANAEAVSGYVAVTFDPSFQVETASSNGLEPRDGRNTPVTGTLAWFRLNDYSFTINASRRPSEIEATIISYALPLANTLEIEGQIDLNILYSGIKEIEVVLPEKFAAKARFESPLLAEQTLGDDGMTWALSFHQERSGFTRIPYRMILPLEMKLASDTKDADGESSGEKKFSIELPHLKIPSAKRIRGDWMMEANTDTELTFEASGLDSVDSLRVPLVANYQPRHRVIAAFQYRGDVWDLKLSGTRHAHTDLISTVIDSLRIDTVVSTDGTDRHQARFRLRSSGEQFLELQLPENAVLWTLQVDGKTIKPVRAGKDTLRVQLPAHENSRQQISIDLIYQTPGKKWGGSGKESLDPIRVAKRIPVMRSEWFLHLPEGFDYQKFKTNLGKEFEVVDRGFLGQALEKGPKTIAKIVAFPFLFIPSEHRAGSSYGRLSPPQIVASESATDPDPFGETDDSRSDFTRNVAQGWEMPIPAAGVENGIQSRENKLKTIIIPSLEFVETPFRDAMEYIRQRSIELDPTGEGINIVMPTGGDVGNTPITLRLSNVPLAEALRYTTSLAQLKYKVESHAVVVIPISSPSADLFTNTYKVPPTFLSTPGGNSDGGGSDPFATPADGRADPFTSPAGSSGGRLGVRKTTKGILEEVGVTFGAGASAIYSSTNGKIIVRNTQDQMELVEAYIQSLGGHSVEGKGLRQRTISDPTELRIERIENQLKTIIIPSLELSETPLAEALDFIMQRSIELDPAGKGLKIILPVGSGSGGIGFEGADTASGIGDTPITLRLRNVPVAEALRYVTSLAQLKYKVESHAVVVVPISTPSADLFTNIYKVPPTFLSTVGRNSGGGGGDPFAAPAEASGGVLGARKTAKDILESAGITFGTGASAIYDAEKGQIIVRNTQDQMELVESFNESLIGGAPDAPKDASRMGGDEIVRGGEGFETRNTGQQFGDFDNGSGLIIDSPYINKPDEGNSNRGISSLDVRNERFAYISHGGSDFQDKTPFLGDLPLIGSIFEKSQSIGNANQKALKNITLDGLDFSGKTLEEAVSILNEKLAEQGDTGAFPAGRIPQVELVTKESDTETAGKKISGLKLAKTSFWDVLDKLTGASNTHYEVTASGILIARKDVPLEPMASIFIPLPASEFGDLGARNVLTKAGIKFPPGSGTAYNPGSGQLAVKNTRENLEAVVKLYSHYLTPQSSAPVKPLFTRNNLGGAQNLRGFDINDIGRRPLEFNLPHSGRSYRFQALYAPDTIRFRYVNWERQIRVAWIWILIGGLAFWLGAWRRFQQPVFIGLAGIIALTFLPLLVSSSLTVFCNALLIGWLGAIGIWLVYQVFGRRSDRDHGQDAHATIGERGV